MKTRLFLISISAALALALSACQSSAKPAAPAQTAAPTSGSAVQSRIEPRSYLDLSFLTAGRVAEISAAEGDTVSAGQVLARLAGSEQRQADLARARQEQLAAEQALSDLKEKAYISNVQSKTAVADARKAVEDAEQKLDKLRESSDLTSAAAMDQAAMRVELAKAQLVTARDQDAALQNGLDPDLLSAAQARIDSAKAAAAAAQAALDALELRAPAAGTLASLSLKTGQFIAAGQPAATLADFSAWVAQTDDLTELEVIKLQSGGSASLTLDALPGQAINGKIAKIATRYVEKRGDTTYQVTIALDALPAAARWGMTGQVTFGEGK